MYPKHADALRLYAFDKSKKLHIGSQTDGGYVIADLSDSYDCYISAGVSNEESFTRDIIKKYGFTKDMCYAFDGTIDDYPYEYTREIQFTRKNIGAYESDKLTNLHNLVDKYNNIFLKMDIEGGEYDWIPTLSREQMNKFKQIAIEFHGINYDGGEWCPNVTFNTKCDILAKLAETHYLIHAHGNNNRWSRQYIPDVIELTYVRKSEFDVEPPLNKEPVPVAGLDFPNVPHLPDIDMNGYPFVN